VTKVVNISVISGTALFFSIFFLSLQGQQKKIERIWSRAIMKYNDSIKEQVTNSFFFFWSLGSSEPCANCWVFFH